jgi:hypothetical protein
MTWGSVLADAGHLNANLEALVPVPAGLRAIFRFDTGELLAEK